MQLLFRIVPINVSTAGVEVLFKLCKSRSKQTLRQCRPFTPSQSAIFHIRPKPIDLSVRPVFEAESHTPRTDIATELDPLYPVSINQDIYTHKGRLYILCKLIGTLPNHPQPVSTSCKKPLHMLIKPDPALIVIKWPVMEGVLSHWHRPSNPTVVPKQAV